MKKLLLLFAATLLTFAFTFEDDLVQKIVNQFEKYHSQFPQEKAYLHLDKPYYTAGETIWFKAYLVEASAHLPDTVSLPLYVDLINNSTGKLIDKKILKLEEGTSYADFKLADTLKAGFYSLRAYTNWMRNFDDRVIFSKDFRVYQIGEQGEPIKLNAQEIDFRLFPEGGSLVEGLESRVAFKAVDMLGNGLDITGIILSDNGDTVMSFESEHLGMGVFSFKPEKDEKYVVKIKYRNIFEKEIAMTEILSEGFAMGVEAVADKDFIRLYVGHNFAAMDGQITVVGQARDKICYVAKTVSTKKTLLVKIPKDKFPQGVAQFTVFDNMGKPRCERLVFIKKEKDITINILPTKKAYLPREKVSLDIEAKDAEGKPVTGNFSVVVSDAKQILRQPYEENVFTNLLLSSELKGKIEQPAYYFDKANPQANRHLDILLMSQGWRRYKWEDIMKPEFSEPTFFIERGISISGEISRPNGKAFEKPINLTFMLAMKDSSRQFAMGEAGKDGHFGMYDLNLVDSVRVMIQAIAGQANRNTKIFVNRLSSPKIQVAAIPFNAVAFDEKELADYLKRTREALELEKRLRFDGAQLLNEVIVKAKKKPEERDSRVIYSHASNTVKVDQSMAGYMNVLDMLRGRVPGVQVSGDAMNPVITIRGASSFTGSSEPLFLLDGMRTDKSAITMIPVSDVDKIDILKGGDAAIFGMGAANGVISVLTKRGGNDYDASKDKALGVEMIDIAGYYPKKEFYSPKYDVERPEHVRPDYRSTIYWAPIVKTDAKGKATITFFNSDAETNVDVLLEGISTNGLPAVVKASYVVKK